MSAKKLDVKAGIDFQKLLALLQWANTSMPVLLPVIESLISIFKESQPSIKGTTLKGDCGLCAAELDEAMHAQVDALAATIRAYHACHCDL